MVNILGLSTQYVANFDSSKWQCLVGRDCGDTMWIPHGSVLADRWDTRTELLFTTGQRSLVRQEIS